MLLGQIPEIDFSKDLRWLLVSALYALAIAEIAVQSANLVANKKRSLGDTSAVAAHLILVTFVVTTSFVGWTLAVARDVHPEHHLVNIFSAPYLLLLVDVWLLVAYFIMAKRAGAPKKEDSELDPSAAKGSFWLVMVFGGYFLWDIIAYWVMHGFAAFVVMIWPTAICLVMGIVAWRCLRLVTARAAMVAANAGMVALVLFFRATKGIAGMYLSQRTDSDWSQIYWNVVVTLGGVEKLYWVMGGTLTLGVLFIAFLCVASLLDRRGQTHVGTC